MTGTSKTPADVRRGIAELLVGATLISFSPVFVKIADIGPTIAGFYRTAFGALFLLIVVIARGEPLWKGRKPLLLALACAGLFAADLTFWHRAIEYIGPGLSTIMGNFQVFFLAAVGILVFREKVDWRFLLSVPLAVAGLMMLVGVDWSALESTYKLGVAFGLLTAVTYAAYVLILQKSQSGSPRLSASANLAVISLGTAAIMAIEGPLQGESFHVPNARSWIAMASYGVLCQALGWIIISHALTRVEASRAGLILLLQPTLAFVWDVLFFARPTDIVDGLGALIALSAIYIGGTRKK
jgi:drug/metabolite transporter (DMT)-like permease